MLYEKETTEPNGVIAELVIKDFWEANDFTKKAKQKLCYYDTVILIIDNNTINNKIYRHELFQWSNLNQNNIIHFSLKDVYYEIDWKKLGISQINIPICLNFDLKQGIKPTPSREGIIWNNQTIELFKNRIKQIASFFYTEYNKHTHFKTFKEAYERIGESTFYVKLAEKSFNINDLIEYSDVKKNEITVEGIKLNSTEFYNDRFDKFFYGYTLVGYYTSGKKWKKDKIYKETTIQKQWELDRNIVVVNQSLTGNIKEYLKEKYPYTTLFVRKVENRTLRSKYLSNDYDSYWNILELSKKKKGEKKKYIEEWNFVENQVLSVIKEEFDIEIKKEYIEFVKEKKEQQKLNKISGVYSSNYIPLNRDKATEITIQKAREHNYKSSLVYDKFTKKISSLNSIGRLTVYRQKDEDIELFDNFYKVFSHKIDFIIIGKNDLKHIKNNKHFKTMTQFLKTRPFARIATAILIEDIINLAPDNDEYILSAFPKYKELLEKLKKYKEIEYTFYIRNEIKEIILEEAKTTNNWDFNIYFDILQLKEIYNQFGWVKYLSPLKNKITEEEKRVINNMMYAITIQKKILNTNFEDVDLVYKPPISVLQEMYIDETGELEGCMECNFNNEVVDGSAYIEQYEA